MKITKNTLLADIIDSHEKRAGTLEMLLRVLLTVFCIKSIVKIVAKKFNNRKEG